MIYTALLDLVLHNMIVHHHLSLKIVVSGVEECDYCCCRCETDTGSGCWCCYLAVSYNSLRLSPQLVTHACPGQQYIIL